jgi:hypothetical protein
MGDQLFVPADFAVPGGLTAGEMRLEPLGPRHNAADYAAWTASTGHIQATPGFPWGDWPHEMSLAENLSDLERHAQDFAGRRGFTYTVLSTATGEVIGCVYIYPPPGPNQGRRSAVVRSWVRLPGWPAISLAGNFRMTQRRSACHRTTSGSRSVIHDAGLGPPSLIRNAEYGRVRSCPAP